MIVTENIRIELLKLAVEILKVEKKPLTVENLMSTYRQLVIRICLPTGI